MALGSILVIEDDDAIRRALTDALRLNHYEVEEAPDGEAGLELALSGEADLVLLDILMPRMDGLEVLERLRAAKPRLPVIFLTARGEAHDRVRGLRLGADDYVVKPFGVDELIARVEAVLRRSAERPSHVPRVEIGGWTVDFETRTATCTAGGAGGERRELPEKECELLRYLVENANRVVTRDELLRCVWGLDPRGMHTRTVDMAVARLRENLGDSPTSPRIVRTVRGRGYMVERAEAGGA